VSFYLNSIAADPTTLEISPEALAELHTKRNKQIKLFRVVKRNPNDIVALNAFLDAIYPEKAASWIERIKP